MIVSAIFSCSIWVSAMPMQYTNMVVDALGKVLGTKIKIEPPHFQTWSKF
jgi:hypothetical protein